MFFRRTTNSSHQNKAIDAKYTDIKSTLHQSESVGQPGQITTSIESPKVKNPNPMLHLIQHHLALLHASSRGNDRIGSSDLLDSGG